MKKVIIPSSSSLSSCKTIDADPVQDANTIEVKWKSADGFSKDPIKIDSVIFINTGRVSRDSDRNVVGTPYDYNEMMKPGNHKSFCYKYFIKNERVVVMKKCTKKKMLYIKSKARALAEINQKFIDKKALRDEGKSDE